MDARIERAAPTFSDRVFQLLRRVEHRVAITSEDREAVFRLRFDAYNRQGLIEPRADSLLFDERYDNAPASWITMTLIDGELAGTMRVNLGFGEDAILPAARVYPDVIAPYLRAGYALVELTRLAAHYDLSRAYPELAYLIVRPGFLAAAHFDVDFAIGSPRAEHLAFYRRVFQFEPWCPPREYPGMTVKWACAGMNFHALRESVERRYPFYASTPAERTALFGPADPKFRARGRAARDLRPVANWPTLAQTI
jgi:hypothetical protein